MVGVRDSFKEDPFQHAAVNSVFVLALAELFPSLAS